MPATPGGPAPAVILVMAGLAGAALTHRADAAILPSVGARTSEQRLERPPGMPTDAELQAAGARFGRIHVEVRDLFDTRRPDEDTSLFRLAIGFADPAFGADRSATVLNASVAHGWDLTRRQTLQLESSVTGRFERGTFRCGLLSLDACYYFRQSPRRVLYLGLSGLEGHRLDADQQVLLGGDNGLRGYPLRYQSGASRWLFTAEQRWFSNWYPFRLFNVGGAVFFDAGRVGGADPLGAPPRGLLRDVGFGLRLGNGRSALGNVVHVDLAFPLDRDPSIDNVQFLVETRRSF